MEQVETTPEPISLELKTLLERMPREARKVKLLGYFQVLLCLVASYTLIYILTARLLGWHSRPDYFSVLTPFLSVASIWVGIYINSESRKRWAKQLVTVQDVRACGAFADVLAFQDEELRKLAKQALLTHLPRLQASDGQFLNDSHRHNLRQLLKGKDVPLILALLRALQQVGDGRDLDAVQRLADGKNKAGKNPEVPLAAAECLPYLQANDERRQHNQSLLRASSPDADTSHVLLRASLTNANEC